jgi:hypothetical protein
MQNTNIMSQCARSDQTVDRGSHRESCSTSIAIQFYFQTEVSTSHISSPAAFGLAPAALPHLGQVPVPCTQASQIEDLASARTPNELAKRELNSS